MHEIMGFKGDSIMNSGYFYCPYVPLLSTPPVMDPNATVRTARTREEIEEEDMREATAILAVVAAEINAEIDAEILADLRIRLSPEELADLEVWRNHEAEEELAQDLRTMTQTATQLCRRKSEKVNWAKDGF